MRFRRKKRHLFLIPFVGYLVFANSCATFRLSEKKTKAFFNENQTVFTDTTAVVDDRDVHYIQTGKPDAPTLVFIHGSPGSWDAYKSYLVDATLIKNYRIIAPDRPGFGKSNFRQSLGLQPQAELLNALLAELDNGKPYTLIGHSYGGPLIVRMALDNPELHKNLVILAGALDPEAENPEKWRIPLKSFPLKYLVPGALRPSNDELWLLKQELWDMEKELAQLTQRVLIIHGTEDQLVPYQNVPFMKNHFTSAEALKVLSLEKENHFIVWSQEELVKNEILKWSQEPNPIPN